MPMSEKEVNDLEKTVFDNVEADLELEAEWIKEQFVPLRLEEQKTMASFRLWKALRDDEKMKASAESIKKTREILVALKERLQEIIAVGGHC